MKRTVDAPTNLFALPRLALVILIAAAFWLGTAMLTVAGDPAAEARWRCPYTPDGSCAPNRATFGWYPTIWRRWPQPHPAAAEPVKKPHPESRVEEKKQEQKTEAPPTAMEEEDDNPPAPPAEEPPPADSAQPQTQSPTQTPAATPTQTPTLAPEQPGGAAPGTKAPGGQSPKKAEPAQGEDDPEKIFNESKKTSDGSEGKPAEKAFGDPFSDDKDQPAKAGGDSSSLRLPDGDHASDLRWRTNPIRRVARDQDEAQPANDGQPRLFQPTPSARSIDDDSARDDSARDGSAGDDRDDPPAFEAEQAAKPLEKISFVQAKAPSRINPLRPAGTPQSAPLSSPLRPSLDR